MLQLPAPNSSFMQSQFDYSQPPRDTTMHTAVLELIRGPSGNQHQYRYLRQLSTSQELGDYCLHSLRHNSGGTAE